MISSADHKHKASAATAAERRNRDGSQPGQVLRGGPQAIGGELGIDVRFARRDGAVGAGAAGGARRQFGGRDQQVAYDYIPTAVFCQPNIGTVGYTEAEARDKFGDITLFKSSFRPMKHTISGREERTFMKLIVEDATDRVVGVHMVGPDAGEIIQGIAIALRAGATKAVFDTTIGIHPTAAEEFVTMRTPRA